MPRFTAARRSLWAFTMLAILALPGCATLGHKARLTGVPIEQRPTPPQPPPDSTTAMVTPRPGEATEIHSPPPSTTPSEPPSPPPPVQTVMSAEERKATMQRIVADTTSASAAIGHCAGKTMLPDQESVFETTRNYLIQARSAIARGELWSAEGLARKARQLASSLECH